MRWAFLLLLASFSAAFGQDERRVTSPDGQLEFRLFVAPQKDTTLFRIAYQLRSKGKLLVDTSFLGLDIWEQEPLLGENVGLTAAAARVTPEYHEILAHYLQNGSTGRSLDIQVRAFDSGVAFRYIVPGTSMLPSLRIADETTEFVLADPATVKISEVRNDSFPAMSVAREEGNIFVSRLARNAASPGIAFEAPTPYACPWRMILLDGLTERAMAASLKTK